MEEIDYHIKNMKQNIRNNRKQQIKTKLYNAHYYDFMLYNGDVKHLSKSYLDDIKVFDFSDLNIIDGILYSTSSWNNAFNDGVEMLDIGFTGMDNGLIGFMKDRITNEKFLDLYLNSKFTINSGDTKLFLTPITGNTQMFNYPMSLVINDDKYISFKGGFYQGFFKLNGFNYQVIPDTIEDSWIMHFDIRPRSDYKVETDTINHVHPENKGMFFFIGTRAENKFWPFYKYSKETMDNLKKVNAQTESYFASGDIYGDDVYNINNNPVVSLENEWILKENVEVVDDGYFAVGDGYFAYDYTSNISYNTDTCIICNNDYFTDDYYDDRCPEIDNGKYAEDDFIGEGVIIDAEGYKDSEGHEHNKRGYVEIETDNKFLLFDRTGSGYTVDTWVEGAKAKLVSRRSWPNANYFMLMNRTESGYTINNIESYNENNLYDYNIFKDIRNNVFALRITDKGEIGYKYGVLDCESDNKFKVIEEYSKPKVVKYDEWNQVNVKFSKISVDKMKILIYVNKFLVFVSKELPLFNFRALDEVSQKQEAVPYNISLGGGSLGLLETIIPNYYAVSDYILPIEQHFCGSFLGDIKSFKMYDGFVDYSTINNYLS